MSQAYAHLSTTGAGVAIGSGAVLLGGVLRSGTATTVTIKDSATTIVSMSADTHLFFPEPIALRGPATLTSSGGTPVIFYRDLP